MVRSEPEQLNDAEVPANDIPHLAAPILAARQAIAAHFLRECEHIVEIGGYTNPVTGYLTHHPRSVTSIDPKTPPFEADELNGTPCRVRHIARKFQQETFDLDPHTYGLVLLGYSLKPWGDNAPDDDQLFRLADGARRVVIDHVLDFARAEAQLPRLLGRGTLREVHRIDMQFHDKDVGDEPFTNRRLLVLEPVPDAS